MLGQLFGRKSEKKTSLAEFERIAMPHADALYGAARLLWTRGSIGAPHPNGPETRRAPTSIGASKTARAISANDLT